MSPSETETLYRAYYVSVQPNNHCNICSFYVPEPRDEVIINGKIAEYVPKDKSLFIYRNCPSCGRLCYRLFVKEGARQPDLVPDSYTTKISYSPERTFNLQNPKEPRESFSPEKWRAHCIKYFKELEGRLGKNLWVDLHAKRMIMGAISLEGVTYVAKKAKLEDEVEDFEARLKKDEEEINFAIDAGKTYRRKLKIRI